MESTAKDLFHERVRAGGRTYFLNVKETREGKPYLSLVESRKNGENFEKSRMLVFQDHLDDFIKGLQSVQTFVAGYVPTGGTETPEGTSQPPPQMEPSRNLPVDDEELPF